MSLLLGLNLNQDTIVTVITVDGRILLSVAQEPLVRSVDFLASENALHERFLKP